MEKSQVTGAPYGYTLVADKVIDQRTGRVKVNSAKWEIEKADADGKLILIHRPGLFTTFSPGLENKGVPAIGLLLELNKLRIPPPQRETWSPRTVIKIANASVTQVRPNITSTVWSITLSGHLVTHNGY